MLDGVGQKEEWEFWKWTDLNVIRSNASTRIQFVLLGAKDAFEGGEE